MGNMLEFIMHSLEFPEVPIIVVHVPLLKTILTQWRMVYFQNKFISIKGWTFLIFQCEMKLLHQMVDFFITLFYEFLQGKPIIVEGIV